VIYPDAGLALKEEAIAKTTPMKKGRAAGRYRPDGRVVAFLKNL